MGNMLLEENISVAWWWSLMKEFPCGWGRQGRIFPPLAVSGTRSVQWGDFVRSIVWGLGVLNVGLWILGCATGEQIISPPELCCSTASWFLHVLALPCPVLQVWGYFGRHAVSSIIWTSWGQCICSPDKPDRKKQTSGCKFSLLQSHVYNWPVGESQCRVCTSLNPMIYLQQTALEPGFLDLLPNIPTIG